MPNWGLEERDTAGSGNMDDHAHGDFKGSGDDFGGDVKCYNCGGMGHMSGSCPEVKKLTGECFRCGEVGHNKADCNNPPKPFEGECRICKEAGHRAAECPNKPPDICKKCSEEGHKAAECTNARKLDYKDVEDMEPAEAWKAMKEAVDDRDIDDFQKAFKSYCKANRDVTYGEMETKFRDSDIAIYIIAIEKVLPPAMTNVNLQGKEGCKYLVNFSFSKRPKRAHFAVGWPENDEENTERLKDAGEPMGHVLPLCFNCKELGHTSKNCPQEIIVPQKTNVTTCTNCGEEGHKMRHCKEPIVDRNKCRRCGKSGHWASGCEQQQSADNVECRKCHEMGHFAKDCPNPAPGGDGGARTCRNCGQEGHFAKECPNESVMICRNCDQEGHMSKDCAQPKDWSRVTCNVCGEKGHGAKKCPQAQQTPDNNAESPNFAAGGYGGGNETYTSVDQAEANGWNDNSGGEAGGKW